MVQMFTLYGGGGHIIMEGLLVTAEYQLSHSDTHHPTMAWTAYLPVATRFWFFRAALYNVKCLPQYEVKKEANQVSP